MAGDAKLPGIKEVDYGLVPGERLGDAITRSWNRLLGVWAAFRQALAALPESETTATALTRERWLRPLLDELGFAGLPAAKGLTIEGKDYPVSHLWGDTVPVHLPGARVPIDRLSPGVRGAARMSPHGLVQELLNRSDDALWGVVSNGLVLRLLRDNASLTRQAYVEFDVEAVFDGESFSDFVLLWLCCHRTRFEGEPAEKCLLEQWSAEAASAGTRALENLRGGVESAIQTLGEGLVRHPANGTLRAAIRSGDVSTVELQRQILRLVYRLIFLLVAESRSLLLDPETDESGRQRYRDFYSVDRLRKLAARRRGTAHDDLWQSLLVTMRALDRSGIPALGLKPLGSFLWSREAVGAIGTATIDNRHLLAAIRHLCWTRDSESKVDRAVDYRNLGAEELGSVYESLLELHAVLDVDGRVFQLDTAAGNERKTTGSYYTPTSLISVLLDSALDPVIAEAEQAADPEEALLGLKVLDPACGSGHFLIAAAHRIAGRLASVRAGGGEPAPDDRRHALRDVVGHCIYGIDVNPMAVELCKVSLWIEATEPGRPLSFLDHRIVAGNSLLGATPALVDGGVPDAAFKPLTGDDRQWASTLKKTNKHERTHATQGIFDFGPALADDVSVLARDMAELDAIDDGSVDDIDEKERRLAELRASGAAERARLAADAWCAAFVAPKSQGHPLITDAVVRQCGRAPDRLAGELRTEIDRLAAEYKFLHLHVAFPEVFQVPDDLAAADNQLCGWTGGFDAVLGNPPWDKVEFKEQEWFATRDPEIARLSGDRRKRAIAKLAVDDPDLHTEYLEALRTTDGQRRLLADTGRFPLTGRGKVNTYAVFAEQMRNAISPTGHVGVIVPSGIATDDTTKFFFGDLVERSSLMSLYDFENRRKVFPGIDSRIKFCLLTLTGDARPQDEAEFVFFALDVADLEDHDKRFVLSPEDFELLNPNTRTCPVFRTRRDAEITKAIYRRVPVLVTEGAPDGNPWGVTFRQGLFNMTSDSHLFSTREDLEGDGWTLEGNHFVRGEERHLPLYEGRFGHQFDHRFAEQPFGESRSITLEQHVDPTVIVEPQYWVESSAFDEARKVSSSAWLGFRRVARNTDERTVIAAVLPFEPASYGWILSLGPSASDLGVLAAAYNSFLFDYITRNSLTQPSIPQGTFAQLPVPEPPSIERHRAFLLSRVVELTYTAWDLAVFAADLGYNNPPFRWHGERRALLRAELDALMFHLYGIQRDDIEFIMDSFTSMRDKDESRHACTKRLILERFDAMEEAEAGRREYETVLDPPPAHPSLAHPESTRPSWAVR